METPLHQMIVDAVMTDNFTDLKEALTKGDAIEEIDDEGHTPLMVAATWDAGITRSLIEKGANVNAVSHLGNTALMKATVAGNIQSAQVLIDFGAEVDKQDATGMTALMKAALWRQGTIVELLLEHGANVNLQCQEGMTPLMYAVLSRDKDCISRLLHKKADPKLKNTQGKTAKDIAVEQADLQIADLLSKFS